MLTQVCQLGQPEVSAALVTSALTSWLSFGLIPESRKMTALLYGIWKWFTHSVCRLPSPHVSYTNRIDDYCEGLGDSAWHRRSVFHSGGELCCSPYIPKGLLPGESHDSATATVNLHLSCPTPVACLMSHCHHTPLCQDSWCLFVLYTVDVVKTKVFPYLVCGVD